ncbi:hypothetical protein Vadar_004100 [Vaccinium darrowii]|uniref:Uncharacterized protein n=1 Tax=Vaccinium darrowii TaxID=229202 RepID=A0ACB7ZH33_9ERIC|nr:hypothetical protein Vadar_004100 [Vaccinium darrowii]
MAVASKLAIPSVSSIHTAVLLHLRVAMSPKKTLRLKENGENRVVHQNGMGGGTVASNVGTFLEVFRACIFKKLKNEVTSVAVCMFIAVNWKEKKRVETERGSELVGVDVDANGDEEDGDEAEVDDGVNSDGGSARLHAAKLHHPVSTRDLEQKTRRQQHEQHQRYQDWAPRRAQSGNPFSNSTPDLTQSTRKAEQRRQREDEKRRGRGWERRVTGVDSETDGQNENGEDNKEKEGVNEHSFPIGLEAPKFHEPGVPRRLKDEPGRKQYEQNQPNQYRCPIQHC